MERQKLDLRVRRSHNFIFFSASKSLKSDLFALQTLRFFDFDNHNEFCVGSHEPLSDQRVVGSQYYGLFQNGCIHERYEYTSSVYCVVDKERVITHFMMS